MRRPIRLEVDSFDLWDMILRRGIYDDPAADSYEVYQSDGNDLRYCIRL